MKTVIVGGVAGGLSAATRLRRLDGSMEIVVFERGRYVSFANCGLPYYVGGVINSRDSLLLQTPESLASRFALDLRVEHEVASIDSARKVVHVTDLRTGTTVASASEGFVLLNDGSRVRAHLVIEATGVRPEVIVARSAGLSIGPTGGIAVDRQQRRGDPAIFAWTTGSRRSTPSMPPRPPSPWRGWLTVMGGPPPTRLPATPSRPGPLSAPRSSESSP